MKLIVAEKPSVARAICPVVGADMAHEGYKEGNGYLVSWCVGHLAGLMSPNDYCEEWRAKWSFAQLPMIPESWQYTVSEKTKDQFDVLKKLMNDSNVEEIICATDADREGECIFRYVYYLVGCVKPVKRLWVSSLEESAIKQGLANMKDSSAYDNLFHAGESRAKADWLVGMNGSRLFTCRYYTTLSLGRVQTPTLAMLVKRDNDIQHFTKQKYFTIDLDCGNFICFSNRIDDEATADNLVTLCTGKTASATHVTKEVKTVNPPKLYDLTTLQREANKKFGYTAQQTLDYLQALYEGKLATYPRTDSQYLSDDMEQTALDVVRIINDVLQFGKVETPDIQRVINNKKVTGHHAIIPTVNIRDKDILSLPEGERNILLLIANRLLCAVALPHKYESVRIEVTCENTVFTANGNTILENGWKTIAKNFKGKSDEKESEEAKLPEITEGQTFENVTAAKSEHWTSPPKSYTEDTLLSAMEHAGQENYDEDSEKKGLGTPATRAAIIEGLVKRGYAERQNKQIVSTEKGRKLIEVVPEEVKSAKLTAEWEMKLQQIEHGQYSANDFMHEIEEYVKTLCDKYASVDESREFNERVILGKCPRCGKNVVEGKMNYYCESGKGGCGFGIWKKFNIPQTTVSAKAAGELLTKGMTKLKAVSRDGKEYTANFRLEDTGQYINLVTVTQIVGTCPRCGKNVVEGALNFYCESGRSGCGFTLWKDQKYHRTVISLKNAQELLSKGETLLTYADREGNKKKAKFQLEDTGKYINLVLRNNN